MSLYVLDTDTLQLFQNQHPLVVARVFAVAPGDGNRNAIKKRSGGVVINQSEIVKAVEGCDDG